VTAGADPGPDGADLRLGGVAGVAFVVLSVVIVFAAPFWPPLGASAADVVAWHTAHRMPFLVGNFLAVAAAVPSLVQLAVVVALIKRADERGWLWLAVLASAVLAHAVGATVLMVYQAIPFVLDDAGAAKALSDLAGAGFALFLLPLGAFLSFTTWAIRRTRIFPAWLGHVGVALALVVFAGSVGAIVADGPLAGGGAVTAWSVTAFFVWCLALSIVMIVRKR